MRWWFPCSIFPPILKGYFLCILNFSYLIDWNGSRECVYSFLLGSFRSGYCLRISVHHRLLGSRFYYFGIRSLKAGQLEIRIHWYFWHEVFRHYLRILGSKQICPDSRLKMERFEIEITLIYINGAIIKAYRQLPHLCPYPILKVRNLDHFYLSKLSN